MYNSVAQQNQLEQELDAQKYILKPLEPSIIAKTINSNSHTKKHMNEEIVARSHEGIGFLVNQ